MRDAGQLAGVASCLCILSCTCCK